MSDISSGTQFTDMGSPESTIYPILQNYVRYDLWIISEQVQNSISNQESTGSELLETLNLALFNVWVRSGR